MLSCIFLQFAFTQTRMHFSVFSIHELADSLFSTSSGFNNYRGLLNLGIVLLVSAMSSNNRAVRKSTLARDSHIRKKNSRIKKIMDLPLN